MQNLLNPLIQYKNLWLAILGILFLGILSNFLVAGAALVLFILSSNTSYKNQFLLLILLSTCILASNLTAGFNFAQNFRFVALGTLLVYLFYNKAIPRNPGNFILPFTIYATIISFIFSPLGLEAVLRGVAYWLMALVIFDACLKSYTVNPESTSQLILGFIILFFGVNFLLIFLGSEMFLDGRYRGVMGNPNELGLLAIFSYAILDLFKHRAETGFSAKNFFYIKLILIGLVLVTGSRTSLFGLILYELITILYGNKFVLIISIGFIVALYYLSLSIDPAAIVDSVGLSEQLRVESLTTGSGRTEVWAVAWEEIKKNPWLGRGMLYDNYFILEYGDGNIGPNRARHWYGIWNSYLSLLLDVGILGLLAYLFFVMKMFVNSHVKNLAAAFLVMTFFAGITESWMAASMNAFTPMFFLYWAIQSQPIKETEI